MRAIAFEKPSKKINQKLLHCQSASILPMALKYFNEYAENIPDGDTSKALSGIAKELKVFLIGGTIPERDNSDNKLYNTCTIWSPSGDLIAKYRKVCILVQNMIND